MRVGRNVLSVLVLASAASGATFALPAGAQATDGSEAGANPLDEAPPAQDVPIPVQGDSYADTDPSALTDYRATLDPHGSWVDDPTYGTVWVPSPDETGADFTPYVSAGHWAYGDDYVWVSDFEWGWAPFHYGRWVWTAGRRWAWIAGREYAGAWVSWRVGDDANPYVGWAPVPPVWVWRNGMAVGVALKPWVPYSFCPRTEIFAASVSTRVVSGELAASVAAHTRPFTVAGTSTSAHPFSQGIMHGPPPESLGVDGAHVVRPGPSDRGIAHALQFARPSTAQPLGARPPVAHVVRSRPIVMPAVAPRVAPVRGNSNAGGAGAGHRR